jgi:hypothetical protein
MSEERNTTIKPPRPKRWRIVALAMVILLCGVSIGVCGTLITIKQRVVYRLHHPEQTADWLTQWTSHALRLSSGETAKVHAIYVRHQTEWLKLRAEVQPRVDAQLTRLREEIAGVLDPRQANVWRNRFDRIRRTWTMPLPAPASPENR